MNSNNTNYVSNKVREAVLTTPFSRDLFKTQHLPWVPYCFYKTVTTVSGKCIFAVLLTLNYSESTLLMKKKSI